MPLPSNGHLRHQVDTLRRKFLQEGGLPLADVLTADCLHEALREIKATCYGRIYTLLTTLWVFLGQVLTVPGSPRPRATASVKCLAGRNSTSVP